MKIVLFGSSGQLGKAIKKSLSKFFKLIVPSRIECDFLKPEMISNFLDQNKPDIIINAAAYTNVDKAEENSEQKNVFLINSNAPRLISEIAKKHGSMVIHFSTDYVFDGTNIIKYKEKDINNPLNVYGKSKLNGDLFISQNLSQFLILRTSWVFSGEKNDFISKILYLCSKKDYFQVISDQIGTPTSVNYLANITKKLIEIYIQNSNDFRYGLYNVAGDNEVSWFGFAKFIIDNSLRKRLISNCTFKAVKPVLTSDYVQLAVRPKYSSLNTNNFLKTFGIKACNWQNEVNKILEKKLT